MSNKEDEKNLGELYSLVVSDDKSMLLPAGVTKDSLKNYLEDMVKAMQPRLRRVSGRPSLNVDDYKIPHNYFRIDSNMVSYHASMGAVLPDLGEDEAAEGGETNTSVTVPNRFREDDVGTQICLYIFKHGRKTMEELITEMPGLDKHMLILLLNKLRLDGYLQIWKEEDDLETLELIPKEKEDVKKLN